MPSYDCYFYVIMTLCYYVIMTFYVIMFYCYYDLLFYHNNSPILTRLIFFPVKYCIIYTEYDYKKNAFISFWIEYKLTRVNFEMQISILITDYLEYYFVMKYFW